MLDRMRNLYHPERFHFHHRLERGGGQFEGWYFKLVDAEGAQRYARWSTETAADATPCPSQSPAQIHS